MKKIDLSEILVNYLRMLEYERGGYQCLLQEFMEESDEEELNLSQENFKILMDRYKEADLKCRLAVEDIVGRPVKGFFIDFEDKELQYD